MREGWKELILEDVVEYRKDKIQFNLVNSSNFISADNMISEIGGITMSEYIPKKGNVSKFEKENILVSNIRPYFKKMWFATFDGGCSNDVFVIKRKVEELDPKFLFYNLSQQEFFDFMMAGANGTKMPRGNKNAIIKYKIILPPLDTQRKIANILSGYDDLIENNQKRIKILEEMAQQTYEEWFVRMRFPGYETAVFGEDGMPKCWEKVKLGELCEKIFDGTHDSPKQTEFGFKLITGKHLQKGKVDFETAYNISEEDHFKIKKRSGLVKDDIMYSNIGTIGNLSMVYEDFEYSCKNMIVFRPKKNFEYFIYTYLFNENTKNKILGEASGSTQKFISLGYIRNYDDVFPTIELISKFNEYCNSIYKSINNLNTQNQRLREARDILLPRLMMGMIDTSTSSVQGVEEMEVCGVEEMVEEGKR